MSDRRTRAVIGAGVVLTTVCLLATAQLSRRSGPAEHHTGPAAPAAVDLAPTSARIAAVPSRGGDSRRASAHVRPTVSPAWVAATAGRLGLDPIAVQAYGRATLRLQQEQPTCRLAWNTLAAIGWVESRHGTIGGRTLLQDGRSSTPVVGPALDGRGFAAIAAAPGSARYHGDRRWEHAVGPMQFLPSTWERWGADGDGDGLRDPHDLDDAGYAAARYLCASGRDLRTAEGWTGAIASYNHSAAYVAEVYAAANAYAG